LTVCQCRWELARGSDGHADVEPSVLAWCRWVYRQLYGGTSGQKLLPDGPPERHLLPRWLEGLGVEVVFLTLHAFGVRERQHQRIASHDVTEANSPREMAEILRRGLERSRVLDNLSLAELQVLDGWIYEEGIERLARRALCVADRSFVATCRHAIRLANEHHVATGRPRQMHQLDLFEGSFYE